jgi:hypothetical protein
MWYRYVKGVITQLLPTAIALTRAAPNMGCHYLRLIACSFMEHSGDSRSSHPPWTMTQAHRRFFHGSQLNRLHIHPYTQYLECIRV